MKMSARALAALMLAVHVHAQQPSEVYEETMKRYAREVCSAPGRTDYMECVPAALERWRVEKTSKSSPIVKAQANVIAAACQSEYDDALQACALRQASGLADTYMHPAGPLAVWDIESARLATETAEVRAKAEECKRLGWRTREPRVGMSAKHARQCGWGDPSRLSKETRADGTSELWTYPGGRYLKLFNGKVQAIGE